MRGRQGRDFADVVSRRDFDDIHSHDVDAIESPQYGQRLVRRQSAADRGSRAGRVAWIQAVDIEGEVNRPVAKGFADHPNDSVDAKLVYARGIDDIEAHRIGILGAQSDLHRRRRIDEAVLYGPVEHRPMVDAIILVGPGVAVRIEMQQRQGRAVFSGMRLEQWVRDEVIATQRQQRRAFLDDLARVCLDRAGHRFGFTMIEKAVTDIGDRKLVQRIELRAVGFFPCHDRRGIANRPRSQPRAGPIGRRRVERHSHNRNIHAVQIARVLATQERGYAGVGGLGRRAA